MRTEKDAVEKWREVREERRQALEWRRALIFEEEARPDQMVPERLPTQTHEPSVNTNRAHEARKRFLKR